MRARNAKSRIQDAKSRAGLTLIELLIVVSVLMIIATAALPKLKPAMEGHRAREGARSLHLFLNSARNTAMASGRACGIMIERLPAEPRCSMLVSQVHVPPPYAGETATACAQVVLAGNTGLVYKLQMILYDDLITTRPSAAPLPVPIQQGDRVQLNGQGPWYDIVGPADATGKVTATSLQLSIELVPGQALPWTTATPNMPQPRVSYKILRRPVKSGASPLQFPAGACIDLQASGPECLASSTTPSWESGATSGTQPIVLMFSPNGGLDQLFYENGVPLRVTDPIYFLVGKREKVDTQQNLDDLGNYWVAVNARTGLITTENLVPIAGGELAARLFQSRTFAREGQNVGGAH